MSKTEIYCTGNNKKAKVKRLWEDIVLNGLQRVKENRILRNNLWIQIFRQIISPENKEEKCYKKKDEKE